MDSIPDSAGVAQAPRISSFRYALRLRPEQFERLSREELLALCTEQYFLLWLIIAIIRNPLAAIASRVVAIDLLLSLVEKNVKGKVRSLTEKTRVYISGDYGTSKRLGIHPNTVSKTFKNLETYRMIERSYIFDEATQKEYLDIALTPMQLSRPQQLQDKTLRKIPSSTLKQIIPPGSLSNELSCPECGSEDVQLVCRECGTVTLSAPTNSTQAINLVAVEEAGALLNKIYVVDTNNAPRNGVDRRKDEVVSDIAQVEDLQETTSPPQEPAIQEDGSTDREEILIAWLKKRIGRNRFIYATGTAEYSKKYVSKSVDYVPDFRAYLAGNKKHILGSYLLAEDKTTSVLAFDIDDPNLNARISEMLVQLAKGGAAPAYWQRQNERGHLELYFDSPVDAESARAWAVSLCPLLAEVAECYPTQDKQNQPISWPLYQRRGEKVTVCRARARIPGQSQEIKASVINKAALISLVSQAVTPAALVEAFSPLQEESAKHHSPPPATQRSTQSDSDLAKVVIAQFNRETTWEDVVALCGGFTRERKFKAVWRGERTASVAIDADEAYACDYGRTGTAYPKKLDKYEVWCLAQGGSEFKRFDLAQRIEAYRKRVQEDVSPATVDQEAPGPGEMQPLSEDATPLVPPVVPSPDETAEEVVSRLRQTLPSSRGYVMTPAGVGKMWQLWPERIGVILDSDPDRVRFFTSLEDMRAIQALIERSS